MRRTVLVMLLAAAPAVPVTAAPAPAPVTIALEGRPRAGVAVAGRLWVLIDRAGRRRAVEVDPAARRPTGRSVAIGRAGEADGPFAWSVAAPPQILAAGGSVWTVDARAGRAVRIDPASARVTARVGPGITAVASGPGGLWALGGTTPLTSAGRVTGVVHRILRLDPQTGAVLGVRAVGPGLGSRPFDRLEVGADRVWLSRRFSRGRRGFEAAWGASAGTPIDGWRFTSHAGVLYSSAFPCTIVVRPGAGPPARRSMRTLPAPLCHDGTVDEAQAQDVAAGPGGSVWQLLLRGRQPVRRLRGIVVWRGIDGTTGVASSVVGRDPVDLIPDGAGVWVVDRAGGRLTRITR